MKTRFSDLPLDLDAATPLHDALLRVYAAGRAATESVISAMPVEVAR